MALFSRYNHSQSQVPPTQSNATSSQPGSSSSTTHFGYRTVASEEKEHLVKNVFSSVASSYDVMNDAMSLGVHRLWKDDFIKLLRPGSKGPVRCMDVAGGTGDIALRMLDWAREKYADRETRVEVVDINPEMLKEGERRFKKTMYYNSELYSHVAVAYSYNVMMSLASQISFHEANAQELPPEKFPSNSYDLYTIAFGIRNVTSIPDVLKEAHRVLKPGGTFACLEFNKVKNPILGQ